MNAFLSRLILAAGIAAIMAVIASAASVGGADARLAAAAEKAFDADSRGADALADGSPLPPASRAALAALWEALSPEQRGHFDRPPPRPF